MTSRKVVYRLWVLSIAFFMTMTLSSFSVTETPDEGMAYSCIEVPTSVEFCGKRIDLSRFDRHERMDRELLAFAYMHSTSIQMLKRANRYFPVVEPILKKNNIPDDFKYLMIIESGGNPTARSYAGAVGLWQFMPATAKSYGLEVNGFIDERYDIEKATEAACKYFHEAYELYGNWESVAASYNAGKGRISQQLSKQDVTTSLDLHLVEETARYVYRILAAKMMFADPAKFGFRLRESDLYPQIPYTVVKTNQTIDNLSDFAQKHGITYAILKNMNPWLRDTSMPCSGRKTYSIKIPTKQGLYYNPKNTEAHMKSTIHPSKR